MAEEPSTVVLQLTAEIVSAHIGNNQVAAEALAPLIQSVYRSLTNAGHPPEAPIVPLTPAVPIRKSVFPDFIVCLEDGKKLKMLKRHLQTSYGLTPDAYRAKWGLSGDYPMVAPNYTARRSDLAKKAGLGRKRGESAISVLPALEARGSRLERLTYQHLISHSSLVPRPR